jgi:hypothetical protein
LLRESMRPPPSTRSLKGEGQALGLCQVLPPGYRCAGSRGGVVPGCVESAVDWGND